MDINYFDVVIGSIVLLLGLKGVLNGFFKELFGLVGIVGGVFIASRFSEEVGGYLSDLLFKFENQSAINLTGFLVVLVIFWASMIALGHIFKKMSILSGLGPVDRILGFVFGASKFFLIISIIAYALYNIKTIRVNLEKPMQNSILFPIMVETGGFIMKLEPVDSVAKVKEKQEELQETLHKGLQEHINDIAQKEAKKVQENIKKQVEEATRKKGE